MAIIISDNIRAKLSAKHNVVPKDVEECIANRCSPEIEEDRPGRTTDPPTMWFIARTNKRRILKIVLVHRDNGRTFLKTAYEPNEDELNYFRQHGGEID